MPKSAPSTSEKSTTSKPKIDEIQQEEDGVKLSFTNWMLGGALVTRGGKKVSLRRKNGSGSVDKVVIVDSGDRADPVEETPKKPSSKSKSKKSRDDARNGEQKDDKQEKSSPTCDKGSHCPHCPTQQAKSETDTKEKKGQEEKKPEDKPSKEVSVSCENCVKKADPKTKEDTSKVCCQQCGTKKEDKSEKCCEKCADEGKEKKKDENSEFCCSKCGAKEEVKMVDDVCCSRCGKASPPGDKKEHEDISKGQSPKSSDKDKNDMKQTEDFTADQDVELIEMVLAKRPHKEIAAKLNVDKKAIGARIAALKKAYGSDDLRALLKDYKESKAAEPSASGGEELPWAENLFNDFPNPVSDDAKGDQAPDNNAGNSGEKSSYDPHWSNSGFEGGVNIAVGNGAGGGRPSIKAVADWDSGSKGNAEATWGNTDTQTVGDAWMRGGNGDGISFNPNAGNTSNSNWENLGNQNAQTQVDQEPAKSAWDDKSVPASSGEIANEINVPIQVGGGGWANYKPSKTPTTQTAQPSTDNKAGTANGAESQENPSSSSAQWNPSFFSPAQTHSIPKGSLKPNALLDANDCAMLETLASQWHEHRWLHLQRDLYNRTRKMINADVIEKKFREDLAVGSQECGSGMVDSSGTVGRGGDGNAWGGNENSGSSGGGGWDTNSAGFGDAGGGGTPKGSSGADPTSW